MISVPKKNFIKYNLAKAHLRIFAALLDFFITIGTCIGLSFAIFNTVLIEGWQVFVFSLVGFVLFFLYFIVIPFFWNGYTLFKYILKIKTVSILLKNIYTKKWFKKLDFIFFIQLFRKEFLIWILPLLIFFIFGIICISIGDVATRNLIATIIQSKNTTIDPMSADSYFIYGTIFITLLSVCFLIDFILFISLLLNSGKRCLHDFFSDTVVIKMVGIDENSSNNNLNSNSVKKDKKIKYNLPGEISSGLIDID